MATVAAIRDGLAVRLETIAGLRVFDTYPDQSNLPAAIVDGPQRIDYHATFAGTADYEFTVLVLVSAGAGLKRAIDALDDYLAVSGTKSIKAAIEGDGQLSNTVHDTTVREAFDVGLLEDAGSTYVGAKFRVEVTSG